MRTSYPLRMRIALNLIILTLFLFGIVTAKNFLYPIVIGVLLGYLFYPLSYMLEKKGLPRIPASLVSVFLFLIIIGTALIIIYKQAGNILDKLPAYKQSALVNIDALESMIEDNFGLRDLRLVDFFRIRIKSFFEAGSTMMTSAFSNVAGLLFHFGILPVYIFLFLYYRTKLAYFILQLVPKENRKIAVKVLYDFSKVVSRYMGGITTVVIIMAFLESAGLWIVGMENPIVFGIISACFSFIPYFGTFIGGAIPFIFTLLTYSSPLIAFKIVILYIVVHFIENNILAPNIVGNSLRLNPMVIIIGVIGGGMVWGVVGMFVIVPLLAMFNIVSENDNRLHAYSFFLGTSGTRKHAITGENIKFFWNRLTRARKKNIKTQ